MSSNATLTGKRWIGILQVVLALVVVTTANAQNRTSTVAPAPEVGAGLSAPTFTKVFGPDTIGPGSVSTLTFTIDNTSGSPVTDLAFTDILPTTPGDVDIADPANASTTCLNGIVTAPDGGGTITFSDGDLGSGESCTVTVDVTASTPGAHTNTTGLTYSELTGEPLTASDDLTVDDDLPGFSKSFAPSSVPVGGRSTLTLTIDNGANSSSVLNLDFTDILPAGMEIADPADASTDCGTTLLPPTLIAESGTSIITLDANGTVTFPALGAEASCTVIVDVIGTASGMLDNISGELLADFVSSGKASATLEVTVTPIALSKSFTDDPVPPGETVTLDFTITNFDRSFSATGISFDDDLTTAVAGLTFSSVLANSCGGSFTGESTTMFGFSGGGSLGPGASCTISIAVDVPGGATPGIFTNTTTAIMATIDSSPVTGNVAMADIFVMAVPRLTKEFRDATTDAPDPVLNAGDDVILRFTIENTSTTSSATDIAFIDELTDGGPSTGFLPFPVTVALPTLPCGAGSSLVLVFIDTDRQGLSLTGGSLTAGAGSTCTFDVTVTTPAGLAPGIYVNTTEEITATVSGETVIGDPASDTVTVIAAPTLSKAFIDDPVAPGGTVTLEFTLTYSADGSGDATAITFTDDLDDALTGLTATLPPTPDPPCGAGSSLSQSSGELTFAGGTLMPGESCTFSVTLDVPIGAASGLHTNTTSDVSATVEGATATSAPATDDLNVTGLLFTKEFIDDPVIPGGTVTLRFTIENVHPSDDATSISFIDDLATVLPGTPDLTVTTLLPAAFCGGTLAISGSSYLSFSGGALMVGDPPCTFDISVEVPAGAADGTYTNTTSDLFATQGGGSVTINPATDALTINSNLLELTKSFTDDPVDPGDPVTLEFTLTNLDASNPVSDIAFTDDLDATLSGLVMASVLSNDCTGSTVSGTGVIDVSGGSLTAGASCTISVSLTVPGGVALGTIATNTTSDVAGKIGLLDVRGDPASDDLRIGFVIFTKVFDGPTTNGGTPTLTFTIENLDETRSVTDIGFIDDLDAVLSGLVATTLPTDPCGTGSSITGTSSLALIAGSLDMAPGAGAKCTFSVELLVPAMAAAGDYPNTSELYVGGLLASTATATLEVTGEPNIVVLKDDELMDSNDIPQPGDRLEYTMEITNTGNADAIGAMLSDTVDPNTTLVCSGPYAPTTTMGTVTMCDDSGPGGVLEVDIGSSGVIPAFIGSVTVVSSVVIDNPLAGGVDEVANQAVLAGTSTNFPDTDSDDPDDLGGPGTENPTITALVASTDVSATLTDALVVDLNGNGKVNPGDTVEYTVEVSNPGDEAAESVLLTVMPGVNTSHVVGSVVAPGGATVTKGNTAGDTYVEVELGTLEGDARSPVNKQLAETTVTFRVTIDTPFPTGVTSVETQGTVGYTDTEGSKAILTDDPATADAVDPTVTPIDIVADLSIVKTLLGASGAGPTIIATYTLTVTNLGPDTATGVKVDDPLPEGATLVSDTPTVGTYDDGVWTIGTLTKDASAMLTIVLTAGDEYTLVNVAVVSGDQADPNMGNNITGSRAQHEGPDLNQFIADLSLTKTVDNETPSVGGMILYTIEVTNNGLSTTSGVVVADSLPDSVAFVSAEATTPVGYDELLGVWTVGHLPRDSTETLKITVLVTGTGQIINTAEIIKNNLPDNVANNDIASATINVTSQQARALTQTLVALIAAEAPTEFELGSNYPNPFNPETVIPFAVPEQAHVRIAVYDLLGREVALLLDEARSVGRYELTWQAGRFPTGVYIVRMQAGSTVMTRRVTLLK